MTEDGKIFGGEEEVIKTSKRVRHGAMELDTEEKKLELLEEFYQNPALAHAVIFENRRKNKSPDFDKDILELFYSDHQFVLAEAFRGAAKSTRVEEYAILASLFKKSRFIIIIGNSYERACERLASIKLEFENNENIIELFGNQVGPTWSADTIVLTNGARIQAFGAKQSLRGAKHGNDRPDLAIVDDLEDEDMVATELARHKARRWFDGSMMPALIPTGQIRMVGTPLHPKSLLEEKRNSPNWRSVRIPIFYLNDKGQEVAAWPDRFPMKWVNETRENYMRAGASTEFEQEYMCRAEDQATKPFQPGMFKRGPKPTGYRAIEIMVDPARTTNLKTSARTGYAVWDWLGNKLTVHEAYGAFHKPDEIITEIFKLNDIYNPVHIGVEADGLEEFIMQPLRSEQVKRGQSLCITPQRAPNDKDRFISGLQPFYVAGDVVHVGNCQELENELTAFPTGRRDVPNALAYATKMRVGKPVYEDFGKQHIVDGLEVDRRTKRYLAISATPSMVAAVLLQYRDGNIYILKDWCRSEPALEGLPIILEEALLEGGDFIGIAPAEQHDKYTNNGIPAVFRGRKNRCLRGNLAAMSIGCMANRLKTTNKGVAAFQVADNARWVINGMARGYARKLQPNGSYADLPEKNQYSLVIEAIESFTSYVNNGNIEGDDELTRSYTSGGRQFISSLPQKGK